MSIVSWTTTTTRRRRSPTCTRSVEALTRLDGSSAAPLGPPAACPPPPQPAVTVADTMIVSRAEQLLAAPGMWNRHDTDASAAVNCPEGAATVSVRCALRKASFDVIGEYDGGGVLMREARALIDSLPHARYNARLIDYNNDPARTFAEVGEYFRLLKGRLAK